MHQARAALLQALQGGQPAPRKALLEGAITATGISKRWLLYALDGLREELGGRLRVVALPGRGAPVAFMLEAAPNAPNPDAGDAPKPEGGQRQHLLERLHRLGVEGGQIEHLALLPLEHLLERVKEAEEKLQPQSQSSNHIASPVHMADPPLTLWELVSALYRATQHPSTPPKLRESLSDSLTHLLALPQAEAEATAAKPTAQGMGRSLLRRFEIKSPRV